MNRQDIYPGRQWRDRFAMWAQEFPKHYWLPEEELKITGFFTKERLTLEQATKRAEREAKPIVPGMAWGHYWEYGWFFAEWTVPQRLEGKRLVFLPGFGEEMLVWVNGKESGAVDKKHTNVTLSRNAKAGQTFRIAAECYAGHGPRMEAGCFCRKGEKPFSDEDICQVVTGPSFAAIWQEEIFQTAMDYLTLYSLLSRLPERSLRAMKVTEGLKQFTLLADFELPEEELAESLVRADEVLKPLLSCTNGSTAPKFTVFGQSHLDLAWLWTLEETRRKAARTYSNQLSLMEEYPDYQFLLCEPPVLEYLKESYPELWKRVKEKAAEERMIPEGAFYVESDTNMPCGESLVRQVLYGKEWFRKEFGVDSRLAWLPDCFGFTPALPQILTQCGVPYFATQKMIRQDPECEPFPYNDFWWQGIDGSRVLAHTYKENNAPLSPGDMIRRWEEDRIQDEGIEGMIYPYGYGDGGGGPTRELVETAQRCIDLEGAPRVKLESPVSYFKALEKRGTENVFTGELYLAWHRGTYTAQAKTKLGVRRAECLLKEAEYWNTVLAGRQIQVAEKKGETQKTSDVASAMERCGRLRGLWDRLLMQEFHDVLPGTGIERVHEEAEAELAAVAGESEELLREILAEIKETLPEAAEEALPDKAAQKRMPAQKRMREKEEYLLLSESLTVRLNGAGQVMSLRALRDGEPWEAVGEPMNTFRLYRNVNSYYDAWEIGSMYEKEEDVLDTKSWSITEDTFEGRPAWRLEGSLKDSLLTQIICLSEDGCMVEFHTRIDWHERHRMLKVDFPSSVRSDHVTGEVAFGAYARPTTRSYQWEKDRYEVCGHRYSVLEDGRSGIALLNDCKYGYSAKEDRISLTLLRSPLMPDMHADQGLQEFSYACFPFAGSFQDAKVAQRAVRFNRRSHLDAGLRSEADRLAEKISPFTLTVEDGKDRSCHVLLEAAKLSEDGSGKMVFRLYEAAGCPQKVRLVLSPAWKTAKVRQADLLEKADSKLPVKDGTFMVEFHAFEIKTLLISLK
ncbi:MAG TPA: alpha-mannosidase [Candidatus Eisenbergiella merdipullorum]|uniref:Alpha-mannosidase n=1 Tax=Candidatus Eisenbergiella merdipullorum TaxID=2838553 RepID=A0A9D2KY49_9FIRM|nr:alpha-mannosidase [Candidatus Eisenbergiella merdipullorum]